MMTMNRRINNGRRRLLTATLLLGLAPPAWAGSVINRATTGAAGTAVSISNAVATKLLQADLTRYAWTIYCAGTAGTIAALMVAGDSVNNAATPAPSQTVGFPIPANALVNSSDFTVRGLDALHQRIDAEAQGGAAISCYTWEEN